MPDDPERFKYYPHDTIRWYPELPEQKVESGVSIDGLRGYLKDQNGRLTTIMLDRESGCWRAITWKDVEAQKDSVRSELKRALEALGHRNNKIEEMGKVIEAQAQKIRDLERLVGLRGGRS